MGKYPNFKWEYSEKVTGKKPHKFSLVFHQKIDVKPNEIDDKDHTFYFLQTLLHDITFYEIPYLLDYHFNDNQGEFENYFLYLKYVFEEEEVYFNYDWQLEGNDIPIQYDANHYKKFKKIFEIVNDWIERKKNELSKVDTAVTLGNSGENDKIVNSEFFEIGNKKKLTHKQKVLLVHYFQVFFGFPDESKLGLNKEQYCKFLSFLFGYDPTNTELYFNGMNRNTDDNPLTVPNLERVIEVFEDLKLDGEYLNELHNDLNVLMKKEIKK